MVNVVLMKIRKIWDGLGTLFIPQRESEWVFLTIFALICLTTAQDVVLLTGEELKAVLFIVKRK